VITLYLLLVSAGFGFDPGFGVGIEAQRAFGDLSVETRVEWVDQSKIDGNSDRITGTLALSYGHPYFGELGGSYAETRNGGSGKSGTRLFVGAGLKRGNYEFGLRYLAPDDTINETYGASARCEWYGKPYLAVRVLWLRYKNPSDVSSNANVAFSIGWRF
jgi:hypothetical protein